MMMSTAKKNSSDTGAKNEIRAASGPGFSTDGISIPTACAPITSGYAQQRRSDGRLWLFGFAFAMRGLPERLQFLIRNRDARVVELWKRSVVLLRDSGADAERGECEKSENDLCHASRLAHVCEVLMKLA